MSHSLRLASSTGHAPHSKRPPAQICLSLRVLLAATPPTLRPVRVGQVRRSRLARTAAVSVEPLFPPQPTNMTPSRGTSRAVRKVKRVAVGRT